MSCSCKNSTERRAVPLKFYWLIASRESRRINMPNIDKIGQSVAKILSFFRMAATAMLNFHIREMLLAGGVWKPQSSHCTKFCKNLSFCCRDIAIFRTTKTAATPPPSQIFEIVKFYWLLGSTESRHISMQNFVKIGRSVAKMLRFFDFSRWRPSAILDLFWAYLDHSQRVLVGRYHSAKFGYDQYSSFHNMNVSKYGAFL